MTQGALLHFKIFGFTLHIQISDDLKLYIESTAELKVCEERAKALDGGPFIIIDLCICCSAERIILNMT